MSAEMLPWEKNQGKTKLNITTGYTVTACSCAPARAVPSGARTKPAPPRYRTSVGFTPENRPRGFGAEAGDVRSSGRAEKTQGHPDFSEATRPRGPRQHPREKTEALEAGVCRLDANTTANIKDCESFRKLSPTWQTSCDGGVPGCGGSPGAASRSPSNVFLRMSWE